MLTWAQIAIGILYSGIAHERQPNFRHRKKNKKKTRNGGILRLRLAYGRRSNNRRTVTILYKLIGYLQYAFILTCRGSSCVHLAVYFVCQKWLLFEPCHLQCMVRLAAARGYQDSGCSKARVLERSMRTELERIISGAPLTHYHQFKQRVNTKNRRTVPQSPKDPKSFLRNRI